MRRTLRPLARVVAGLAAAALTIQSAWAQSILRDAETEALLRDMSAPLVAASGLDPKNVDIVLVNDPSINAFVIGGQAVYLHSGLIGVADTANQVQGVIAHELGHITGGHAISTGEGAKAASGISLLSMLLGVAAAVAGAGDAAMGVIAAGQQAALGKFLGSELPVEGWHFGPRQHRVLQEAAEPGVPLRLRAQRRQRLLPDPPVARGPRHAPDRDLLGRSRMAEAEQPRARTALPARQGQALRLSRRAAPDPAGLPRNHQDRARPLRPRLCVP
jgi:hypothetical protein